MLFDEFSAFSRTFFLILQATFPFHYGPTFVIVLRQFAKNGFKIDLTITRRTITPRTIEPTLITSKSALFSGGIEFSIFYMKRFNTFMLKIDILQVIQLLQYKMRRIVQQTSPLVIIDGFQKHLVSFAIK